MVKTREVNPWGLYDMLGNVWEWCEDSWGGKRYGGAAREDPVGRTGPLRVLRGGSWLHRARGVRAAYRHGGLPVLRGAIFGFRLAGGPALRAEPGKTVSVESEKE